MTNYICSSTLHTGLCGFCVCDNAAPNTSQGVHRFLSRPSPTSTPQMTNSLTAYLLVNYINDSIPCASLISLQATDGQCYCMRSLRKQMFILPYWSTETIQRKQPHSPDQGARSAHRWPPAMLTSLCSETQSQRERWRIKWRTAGSLNHWSHHHTWKHKDRRKDQSSVW